MSLALSNNSYWIPLLMQGLLWALSLYFCKFSDYSLKWHLQLYYYFFPSHWSLLPELLEGRVMNLIHSLCLSDQQWVFYKVQHFSDYWKHGYIDGWLFLLTLAYLQSLSIIAQSQLCSMWLSIVEGISVYNGVDWVVWSTVIYFLKIILFLAVVGLHCCTDFYLVVDIGGYSSCGMQASLLWLLLSWSTGFRTHRLQ